jgi:hypothetical protein
MGPGTAISAPGFLFKSKVEKCDLYKVQWLLRDYLRSGGRGFVAFESANHEPVVRLHGSCKVELRAGPQLDLPHNVTTENLETLLNGLLRQTESQPYSFFVEDHQLTNELGTFLQKHKVCLTI